MSNNENKQSNRKIGQQTNFCCDDLRTFDVEIQCKKDVVFFERCIYYASGFYSRSILKGEDYDKLHPVYIVSFLDFTLDFENKAGIDSSKIITKYTMVEESTKIFTPSTILCIFAQLPRFKSRWN